MPDTRTGQTEITQRVCVLDSLIAGDTAFEYPRRAVPSPNVSFQMKEVEYALGSSEFGRQSAETNA
jgi:hypothetical protein